MPGKMKVVCPKCKAKLKFDPDKITSDTVRFKCPGCATVLCIRKPGSQKKTFPAPSPGQAVANAGINMDEPGAELQDLAEKFELEMGFSGDDHAEEPGVVGQEAFPAAAKHGESPEKKEPGEGSVAAPEPDGADTSGSRSYKRVKFKKKVLVNNQIMVEVLDISENGLFLHTGRSFDDGAIVEVGIPTMPGNFDLKVQAMVKHNHRGIGMGMQFIDLDDKQKTQLHKLINELDAAAAKGLEGRKKILLVGGTDTARNIIKSKLVLDGFYVMQALSPEEVLTILDNEPPDAMIMDWQEPKFNCKGLIARIKEKPRYDAIIRLVFSALTDSSVQREILDAGAHRCMAKMDTNPARLSLVLKQLINERDA